MKHPQRYVSKELTHFVGRKYRKPDGSHDQEAQYTCLMQILRDQRLLHRQDSPDGPARVEFLPSESFVGRRMIRLDAVYFCDIPVADFGIHMEKYSAFGLSFLKSFLVEQGANPAFYIAHNSIVPPEDAAAEFLFRGPAESPQPLTRGRLMEELIRQHYGWRNRLRSQWWGNGVRSGFTSEGSVQFYASVIGDMIDAHFPSFCVPFDSAKDDSDDENYYMEREWRVIGDVKFRLEDVCRVILPSQYAQRFREDLPKYCGELTFSD